MSAGSIRKFYIWFTILGLLVGGLVVLGYFRDENREWKDYQYKYIQEELRRASTAQQRALAQQIPIEIRQVILPDLTRVDRCMSCHLTVDDPSYGGYPQPLAYHPLHEQHPVEKFGCTVCHRGQGRATTVSDAHGNVPHWDEPMLPLRYIQSSCGQCHEATDNPAAPELAHGQQVFEASGCLGCHKLNNVGGVIGPALDKVGARHSAEWLKKHFLTPAAITPGSAMPPQNLSETDLEAITLFMLSQTGETVPGYYTSMKVIPSTGLGQRLFEQKGCIGCHSVAGKGGNVGPALDDVGLRRSPDWMVQHFRDPKVVSPGSVMPQFGFTEDEARALTDFLVQLSEQKVAMSLPSALGPVERGHEVYRKYGCAGCHGADGKGGVPNPNSKTAELVPDLIRVAEGYTKDELKDRILKGQREIATLDPKRPPPPLYMPAWAGTIKDSEVDDLVVYLLSLKPKGEESGF
ncbi:MAG: c-type cytochrome [Verrucomicrobia bacterium]|nr:c-type cytochrome [Verrucomicrobiota bacterium]